MIQFKRLLKSILLKLKRTIFSIGEDTRFLPPQYKHAELGNLAFGHSRGNYPLDRDKYQDIMWHFLDENGFDTYGYYKDRPNSEEDNASFENHTFVVRPYYWGNEEDIQRLPNFYYKPTKLEIRWYKYALRDSYSNKNITPEELSNILKKCSESIRKDGNHIDYAELV